ncbi:MAG: rod shape-determining protein MreC [Patescibacteria group bacterium]
MKKFSHLNRRSPAWLTAWHRWGGLALLIVTILFLASAGSWLSGLLSGPMINTLDVGWRTGGWLERQLTGWRVLFVTKSNLQVENRQLRSEIERRNVILASYRLLVEENHRLAALLGRQPAEGKPVAMARVLSRASQSPYDALLIDLGHDNSSVPLTVGDWVVVDGQIALGQIAAVASRTAKVKLFSLPGVETPVRVGDDEVVSLARGQGGGNFSIRLPRSLEVSSGAPVRVVAPDRMLTLGVVAETIKTPADSFQEIIFKTPVNIYELNYVEIYPAALAL